MLGPLLCRNDTQCRPRFGNIWRCRRHVGDTSATCGAKLLSHCHAYNRTRLVYTTGETVAGDITLTMAIPKFHTPSQDNRLPKVTKGERSETAGGDAIANKPTSGHTPRLSVPSRDRGDTEKRHSNGNGKLLDTGHERSISRDETRTAPRTTSKEARRNLQEDILEYSKRHPRSLPGTGEL